MNLQQITQNEANISLLNQVFAKVFNSKISVKFQKFQNDFRLDKIKIEDSKLQKLKELLKALNTNQISKAEFVDKIGKWL